MTFRPVFFQGDDGGSSFGCICIYIQTRTDCTLILIQACVIVVIVCAGDNFKSGGSDMVDLETTEVIHY